MNERIIELELENERLQKMCDELERIAHYCIDQLPQTKANRFVALFASGYEIIKSNMTLIVFLNGITLFGYGLSELL